MPPNPLIQRLILAGASPQRAQAFATSFAQKVGVTKPAAIEDAFDAQLGALSEARWPGAFRPPTPDSAEFNDYVNAVMGKGTTQGIEDRVFAKNASSWKKASLAGGYQAKIANLIKVGHSITDINTVIVKANDAGLLNDWPLSGAFGANITSTVQAFAKDIYDEYTKATPLVFDAIQGFATKNKYYAAGLPDPKLKYGKVTDLAKGEIAYTTNPYVAGYIEKNPVFARQKALAQSPASGYIGASPDKGAAFLKMRTDAQDSGVRMGDDLFKQFLTSGLTPFNDEVKRRESLKKKTTLP